MRILLDRTAVRPGWCGKIWSGLGIEEYMTGRIDRRDFLKAAGISAGWAATVPAWAQQRKRNVKIGHTGITWVQPSPPRPPADTSPSPPPPANRGLGGPRRVDPVYIEGIFKDVSGLGYYGLELFTYQIQGMEANGGMAPLIEK